MCVSDVVVLALDNLLIGLLGLLAFILELLFKLFCCLFVEGLHLSENRLDSMCLYGLLKFHKLLPVRLIITDTYQCLIKGLQPILESPQE